MELIKFEMPNCNPCKMVGRFLDSNGVNYKKIDASSYPEMAENFGIMAVPVVILLDNDGNETQRVVGFKVNELKDIVSKLQ